MAAAALAAVVLALGLAATAGAASAAPRKAGAVAWTARFFAATLNPRADTAWNYCVVVVEPTKITAIQAKVTQRLFDGQGNPIGEVGSATFLGAWCQAIKLPASIKGQAITLETKVIAKGVERRLRTPIRVS